MLDAFLLCLEMVFHGHEYKYTNILPSICWYFIHDVDDILRDKVNFSIVNSLQSCALDCSVFIIVTISNCQLGKRRHVHSRRFGMARS
jgi:hypothetical protein